MNNPPRLALLFLRWFCRRELLPGIEGDLMELFDQNEKRYGLKKARWRFVWDVMRLFRPQVIRPMGGIRHMNTVGLLRHNTLMSLRILKKDRVYACINLFGLAMGIASFLAIYQFVRHERSFDRFHMDGGRIYRLTADFSIDGMERRYLATTPPRIAPHAAERIPEIEGFARLNDYFTAGKGDLTLAAGGKKFRERSVGFAHPPFLEIFSFPLIQGDRATCLREIRTIVLTESTARKYFGEDDPMGEIVLVDGSTMPYTVTGVMRDIPGNSSIRFDALISYKTLDWWYEGEAENHWTNHEFYSYFLLEDGANPVLVEEKINEYYLEVRGEYNESRNFDHHFSLQPLYAIHFSTRFENELALSKNINPTIVRVLLYIGWLILATAWINYLNLSTARSLRRYAEMGIRKTLGAQQVQLLGLFVGESLLIHLGALFIAGSILWFLGEYLQDILGVGFGSEWLPWVVQGQVLLATLVTATMIGLYPALLLSRIKHVKGLGSSRHLGASKNWFLKTLVVVQFAISTSLVIGSVIMHAQLDLMRTSDTGFDPYNKLVIRGPNLIDTDSDSLTRVMHQRFVNDLSRQSMVKAITTAFNVPGEPTVDPCAIQVKGYAQRESQTFDILNVGLGYFKTLDIRLQAGRTFDHSSENDVVLNESAVRLLGFHVTDSILGKKLILNHKYELSVIGVVDDYNHLSSRYPIEPLVFYCDQDYVHYYIVDYAGHPSKVLDKAESLLTDVFPRDPFDAFFLDDRYEEQYAYDEKLGQTILLFSAIAIVIACLGLIGLASHNTLRRVKEIGIRKTFGADVSQILVLLNKDTFGLLILANIITWPIMYQLMSRYLEGFATRIPLGVDVFLIAGAAMAAIAILSISFITIKAARANPVDSLRNE